MAPFKLLACVLAMQCTALTVYAADTSDVKAMIALVEGPDAKSSEKMDKLTIEQMLKKLQVPGVSIAVVHDFKLHWAKGYGVLDAGGDQAVDAATLFQAASISKPVTALGAMRLVQDRKLSLDADVNTILKSWKVPSMAAAGWAPVTPRSLFSHTSGAIDGFGFDGYEPGAPLPTPVQMLQGAAPANHGAVRFGYAPYEISKYSGGGLVIMQQALMDVTGQAFAPWMEATVLAPLKMTRSSFLPPVSDERNVALAHSKTGARGNVPWHVYPEMAPASLWTTPTDLAAFMIEIQTALRGPQGRVLKQHTAREMTMPVGVGRYAVGPAIDQRGEGWYFSHSGSNWGYRAFMMGHLRKGYGLVLMANGDNGMAVMNQLADRITEAYDWDSESRVQKVNPSKRHP